MKSILRILIILFISGCSYKPTNKPLKDFQGHELQILSSLYKIQNDTIKFLRVVNEGNKDFIMTGIVWTDEKAIDHQRFDSTVLTIDIDSIVTDYESQAYTSILSTERDVMFIQIIPDSSMSSLDALGFLNYRQVMEERIDLALKQKKLGEWFAGDLGAGANMLFFVDHWNEALSTVILELEKEGLVGNTLISKRLYIADDDWMHEVVFPVDYEGVFNSM